MEKRKTRASNKEQEDSKNTQFNISELDSSLENNELVGGENPGKSVKQGDYLASG